MPLKRLSPEERILVGTKRLNFTLGEIKEAMDQSDGDFDEPLQAIRLRGILRVVIRCRHRSQTSWSISVILNSDRFDGRIDCVDWEHYFVSMEGARCSGFHRHIWNGKTRSCERYKQALSSFRPSSAEEFIVQGLGLIGIITKKEGPSNVSDQMSIS